MHHDKQIGKAIYCSCLNSLSRMHYILLQVLSIGEKNSLKFSLMWFEKDVVGLSKDLKELRLETNSLS